MAATVTLSTTTLSAPCDAHEGVVRLASTSEVLVGYRLFVDGEVMRVLGIGVGNQVTVIRGADSTSGAIHPSGTTAYIAQAHQLYGKDPVGAPPEAVEVSPWINVHNGKVWFAQGDPLPVGGNVLRWWQERQTAHAIGPVGVRTTTYDPTSST